MTKSRIKIICPVCGKEFERWKAYVKNIKTPTCSYSCSGKYSSIRKQGEGNPKWRGGKTLMRDGRILVYAPDHPNANAIGGKYILEYRLIAEQKVGRLLNDNEIVHHINGDVTDNRLENIELMTQAEHARLHGLIHNNLMGGVE
jgi:hypothetical protein